MKKHTGKTIANVLLTGVMVVCALGIIAHYAAPYIKAEQKQKELQQYLATTDEVKTQEEVKVETPTSTPNPEVAIPETPEPKKEVPKRLRAYDIFDENTMGYVTIGDLQVVMGYGYGEEDENGVVQDLEGQCFLNLQSDADNLVVKGHSNNNCFVALYWQKIGNIITVQFDAASDELTRYEVVATEWLSDEEYEANSCAAVYENDYDMTFVTCKSEKNKNGEKIHGCLLVRCMEVE